MDDALFSAAPRNAVEAAPPASSLINDEKTQVNNSNRGKATPHRYGLPLLLFSPEQKVRVLSQAFELLGPRGVLHQFTYAGRCPVERDLRTKLSIKSSLLGIAPFNLPPAFVYRLSRA